VDDEVSGHSKGSAIWEALFRSRLEPGKTLPCIWSALQDGQITDEVRRRIERELDLEEASLAFKRKGEPDPPL
jgi:CPA1 family monovalent cation:H+ antiporter